MRRKHCIEKRKKTDNGFAMKMSHTPVGLSVLVCGVCLGYLLNICYNLIFPNGHHIGKKDNHHFWKK